MYSLSRSLNRSVLAITIIYEHIHSSISSSLGATHAQQRPPLSDIKTWRIGGSVAADPRAIIRHHRASSLARQPGNERIGQQSSSGRFYLFKRPRGVVVDQSYLSFRWPRGAADHIIIIEASNLDEGQGWNTSH